MELAFELAYSCFLIASPWVAGATIALHAGRLMHVSTGFKWVLVGSGGVCGYFALAGVMFLCIENSTFFSSIHVKGLALAALMLITYVANSCRSKVWNSVTTGLSRPDIAGFTVSLLLVSTLLSVLAHAIWDPVASWDALSGEWKVPGYAERAKELIRQIDADEIVGESFEHRHPITNVLLLTWAGWISKDFLGLGIGLPWFLMYTSCVIIVAGYSLGTANSSLVALLIGWCTSTIPLFENHAALFGYTEMLIASVLVSCCAVISYPHRNEHRYLFPTIGVFLALLLLFTKSTGPAYLFAVLFGSTLAYVLRRSHTFTAVVLLCATAIALYAAVNGFSFQLGGNSVAWRPGERMVEFAGRTQALLVLDINKMATNQIYALFVNSSFSIMLASLLLAPLFLSRGTEVKDKSRLIMLLTTIGIGLLFFVSTQMTEYGMLHATFGKDTQNSRSMMPLFVLSGLCIAHFFSSLIETEQDPAALPEDRV